MWNPSMEMMSASTNGVAHSPTRSHLRSSAPSHLLPPLSAPLASSHSYSDPSMWNPSMEMTSTSIDGVAPSPTRSHLRSSAPLASSHSLPDPSMWNPSMEMASSSTDGVAHSSTRSHLRSSAPSHLLPPLSAPLASSHSHPDPSMRNPSMEMTSASTDAVPHSPTQSHLRSSAPSHLLPPLSASLASSYSRPDPSMWNPSMEMTSTSTDGVASSPTRSHLRLSAPSHLLPPLSAPLASSHSRPDPSMWNPYMEMTSASKDGVAHSPTQSHLRSSAPSHLLPSLSAPLASSHSRPDPSMWNASMKMTSAFADDAACSFAQAHLRSPALSRLLPPLFTLPASIPSRLNPSMWNPSMDMTSTYVDFVVPSLARAHSRLPALNHLFPLSTPPASFSSRPYQSMWNPSMEMTSAPIDFVASSRARAQTWSLAPSRLLPPLFAPPVSSFSCPNPSVWNSSMEMTLNSTYGTVPSPVRAHSRSPALSRLLPPLSTLPASFSSHLDPSMSNPSMEITLISANDTTSFPIGVHSEVAPRPIADSPIEEAIYYQGQNRSEPNYIGLALPYGTVTKDWENIHRRKDKLLKFLSSLQQPTKMAIISDKMTGGEMVNCSGKQTEQKEMVEIIDLSDDENENNARCTKLVPEINKQFTASELAGNPMKSMASNGRDHSYESMHDGDKNTQIVPYDQSAAVVSHLPLQVSWQPSIQFEKVLLQKRPEEARMKDLEAANVVEKKADTQVFLSFHTEKKRRRTDPSLHMQVNEDAAIVPRQRKRKCDPDPAAADFSLDLQKPGISSETDMSLEEEEKPVIESDGLEDYWKDFALAVESTKLEAADETENEKDVVNAKVEDNDCNHDIRIHEDLGHVCRICGMIVRRADSIIDYQWKKASRRRTNYYEGHSKEADEIDCGTVKLSEDFIVADIAIHPRHAKEMRSHQLDGFNFLVKNLVTDKPGGCILAHAPGSGKTFMLISFIQSFLARYPSARPLIVVPKFVVSHWKDEFQRWQVQDIPLYDFYSVKAEKRVEQLEVLKSWESEMSILFLGYTQFSRIVSDDGGGNVAAACRDRLLKVPNLLILDEGHRPRNQDTNVLETLNRVETPRKVVLSGTLFQNHVHEVFTILDLVRPKFLKMESSRPIVRRIMSQVEISGRPSKVIADSAFFNSVEATLLSDANINRKAHLIRGLRELTKDVLHYYKGDMLDELPGIVDFSVFLKLSPKQKDAVHKLGAYDKFKSDAVGAALYVHPCLSELSEVNAEDRDGSLTDSSIDSMIDSINFRDGVKTRFFMNILALAESTGEKILAFSQYKLPMKFLERLLVKMKGWHVGKEIFVISGDAKSDNRDLAKDQFNSSADAKVLFGSIKACGEGISLVGASRVIILDVCVNPSITRQAIGRAFRPGQQKKVFVYRLVAAESPEEKSHETAVKKDVIPKLWFEWSEHCTTGDFKLDQIDINDCGDELLDNKAMRQDIMALYKRKQAC